MKYVLIFTQTIKHRTNTGK